MLYLRYTDTPKKDLERGVSFHHGEGEYNEEFGYEVTELNGLCAFELESREIEEAIEEAKEFYFSGSYNTDEDSSYVIMKGDFSGHCEEGVLIKNAEILYTVKGTYFEE